MSGESADDDPTVDDYHTASQGLIVQLVNKVLFRFGSQSLIRRLLNGRSLSGRDASGRLLTSGSHRARKGSRRAGTLSTAALLATTPSLGESPSLLSGFTAFMKHDQQEAGSPTAHTWEQVPPLELSPAAFAAMVAATPADLVPEVLAARKDEYGEQLRRLEKARKELVRRLADLDDRILQAVAERRNVEEQLRAAQGEQEARGSDSSRPTNSRSTSSEARAPSITSGGAAPNNQVTVEDVSDDDAEIDTAQLYEPDDARRLRKLVHACPGHYGAITALSCDATLGLLASGSLDTQVRIYDMDSGECQQVIGGHSDIIRQVQFHERFLLTASNDSRIRMWDLSLLDSVKPRESTLEMLESFAPPSSGDGEPFAGPALTLQSTTPPMTPSIYRHTAPLELCCETTFVGHSDAVTCFQAAGNTLISGSADKTVREWDLGSGEMRQIIDVTWATRDAQTLRVSSKPAPQLPAGHRRASWASSNSSSPAFLRAAAADAGVRGTDGGDGGFIGALQFYQFALATGSADGCLRLWDLRTAQAHRQLFGHTQAVTSLQFDERSVVTGSLDGTAVVWDLRMGRMQQKLVFGGAVSSVQLVQAQRARLYAAECWIAAGDAQLHHYKADAMQRLSYASDYGALNSSHSRGLIARCSSGDATVTRLHCADHGVLVSGDAEGVVKLWNV
ncbi:Mitochondrial fission protein [Coemansia sp. RSA 2711]|nr:Mitochondrial fission protein [Coemansia sp. RSA 2711]